MAEHQCVTSAVGVDMEELTEAETWAIFDAESRRVLGISGEEFEERWRTGDLASSDDPSVTRVAMLLPSAW